MRAYEVIEAVRKGRHSGHEWIMCEEFRLGAGFTCESRIDLWAISAHPSARHRSVAYEVKVSRSDFLADMKKPDKHDAARLVADEFYFAAPKGLLKPSEIPEWAGLVEVARGTASLSERVKVRKFAPKGKKDPPSWGLVVSLLRRVPAQNLDEGDFEGEVVNRKIPVVMGLGVGRDPEKRPSSANPPPPPKPKSSPSSYMPKAPKPRNPDSW